MTWFDVASAGIGVHFEPRTSAPDCAESDYSREVVEGWQRIVYTRSEVECWPVWVLTLVT